MFASYRKILQEIFFIIFNLFLDRDVVIIKVFEILLILNMFSNR